MESIEDRGYPILPTAIVDFSPYPHFRTAGLVNRMPIRHNRIQSHFQSGYLIPRRIHNTNQAWQRVQSLVRESVSDATKTTLLSEIVVAQFIEDVLDTVLDRIGNAPYEPHLFPEINDLGVMPAAARKRALRKRAAERLTDTERSGGEGLTMELIEKLTKSALYIALAKRQRSGKQARFGSPGLSKYYMDGTWRRRLKAFFTLDDSIVRKWGHHANRYRCLMTQIEYYIRLAFQPDPTQAIRTYRTALLDCAVRAL